MSTRLRTSITCGLLAAALTLAGCTSKSGAAGTSSAGSTSTATSSAQPAGSTAASSPAAATTITEPSTLPSVSTSAAGSPDAGTPLSSGADTSPLPEATVNTPSADALKVLGLMNDALLTPAEVGTGFTKAQYVAPKPKDPTKLPCGTLSAAALYPNALRTGATADQGQAAEFIESASLFLDAATAGKAFQANVDGVSCTKGDLNGATVEISQGQDVTSQVGGDKAGAWSITFEGYQGVLIAVTSGSLVLGFTFIADSSTDTSKLPNPLALAKAATEKMLATGVS